NMNVDDLKIYKNSIITVGDYDKSCGFICGREELKNWNSLEICHLLHTTKDIFGSLKDFVPLYTNEDVENYVKLSVGNLYHELCHRYVHNDKESNVTCFPQTCKSVFFILQNLHYLKSGEFYSTKNELLENLCDEKDKEILALSMTLNSFENTKYDFDKAFNFMLEWCQSTLSNLNY
ncbi:MAG: hypothetical protein K2G73_00745, partial [Eubacterium sp.]|nr:hypothetical protein [Eubacterium sp.]